MASAAEVIAPALTREEQIAAAEQLSKITERNMAMAQRGAAQRLGTCPWGEGGSLETASVASSRKPSPRPTCPWGTAGNEEPAKGKKLGTRPQDTCPWSASANDKDSKRLADAARMRQKPLPSHQGCAGSGAPKIPPKMLPREEAAAVAENAFIPQMSQQQASNEAAEATLKVESFQGGGDEDEQDEQREIIQQCLAEGLSEERIMEILDEWQNSKLMQITADRMKREQPAANPFQGAPQHEAFGVCGTSVAASRQAKASKSLAFGPSDEEIVGVLKDYKKENITPQSGSPSSVSLAAKRAKDREHSGAAIGSFDTDLSRAAYLESKSKMAQNKQRLSSGIF